MKDCSYCEELKGFLDGENIEYTDVDINKEENKEESDTVFKITNTNSVPIVRVENQLLAPDVSFSSIEECFELIKKFMV